MFRVLLVDDDPIVLIQLRNITDWQKLNCELVAEASNGEEAIRAIDTFQPQIIITDISMPGMNGIDLIQHARKINKNIQVIAISAFDDFNYVRESLKGGAGDYLLKHQLNESVLEETILNAISQIDQEESGKTSYASAQEKKERLMYRILHGNFSDMEQEELEKLGIGWLQNDSIVVCGRILEASLDNMNIALVLMDETIKYYQDYLILPLEKKNYVIVLKARKQQEITEVIEQLQTSLKRFCDVDMSFIISGCVNGYEKIAESLELCEQVMNDYVFKGQRNFIVRVEDQNDSQMYYITPETEDRMIQKLRKGESAEKLFRQIYKECHMEYYTKKQMQFFGVEMINLLMRQTGNRNIQTEEGYLETEHLYDEIFGIETAEEMRRYLVDKFDVLQTEIIEQKKQSGYSSIVKEAIKYIDDNYRNKVSLSEIAEALSVSPAYLSRIFKKDTGENITFYVNKVRMEIARHLISERKMTLNEIAVEVGIQNYNYFYILFKEIHGISPSEYTKMSNK